MSTTSASDELDEMPAAPGGAAVEFEANMTGELMEQVPEMGEPFPQGVYHFRLDSYTKGKNADDGQPYFMIQWKCQQEPHVGKNFLDFCPWIAKETVEEANDPNHPNNAAAMKLVKDRLWKAKTYEKAAGFKRVGAYNFETDFLGSHPEIKIRLVVAERKAKTDKKDPKTGKAIYQGTGQQGNRSVEYLPLFKQGA